MRREILTLLLVGALAQACSCDSVPDAALTSCELSQVVQGAVQTEILFVVDDSGSMDEEQANLRDNLSTFISTLQGSSVANDFRIGVTTTSVSTFPANAASGLQGCLIGPWLDPAVLGSGLLAAFQAQIDAVGTTGSGKEQPFRAMELALTTPGLAGCTDNDGFLRPGSRLAVVFLSDEDDCSDAANGADSNRECHNDAGDGIDYKFTRIDSIDHYAAFLQGSIGGEPRDVILASIVGVDAVTTAPTCGYDASLANGWCCGSPLLDDAATCPAGTNGSRAVTNAGLAGETYCGGTAAAPYCTSSCSTAYDKADRFSALLARFPSNKRLVASVCDASFASALQQIAGLISSPTVPLEGEPADHRMMLVALRQPDGSRTPCTVALEGTPEAATADAVYAPSQGSSPATLTFPETGGCSLASGEHRIEIDVICAG